VVRKITLKDQDDPPSETHRQREVLDRPEYIRYGFGTVVSFGNRPERDTHGHPPQIRDDCAVTLEADTTGHSLYGQFVFGVVQTPLTFKNRGYRRNVFGRRGYLIN